MAESADIVITVEKRDSLGKGDVGRLRREGRIPAVVYGGGKSSLPISVDEKSIRELLKGASGGNTIFLLKLKGGKEERRAMIKELQVDPISGHFLHLDFIRVTRGHKLQVSIPLELQGESEGVRHGGRLNFIKREVAVELLPREMLDRLTVDITGLDIGDHLTLESIADQLPPSARFLDDPSRVIATVEPPRSIATEEEEEAGLEELVIGEQAEPELIGRSREEGGEEGA